MISQSEGKTHVPLIHVFVEGFSWCRTSEVLAEHDGDLAAAHRSALCFFFIPISCVIHFSGWKGEGEEGGMGRDGGGGRGEGKFFEKTGDNAPGFPGTAPRMRAPAFTCHSFLVGLSSHACVTVNAVTGWVQK